MAESVSQLRELAALASGGGPRMAAPGPSPLWPVVIPAIRLALALSASWSVAGREHVPRRGPVLVACNHFSFIDPPVLAAAFPRAGHVLAKRELFGARLSWVITALGAIPIRRYEADVDALATCLDALRQGRVVAIFPEGTRGRERPAALKPGHRGVALLAHLSGAPVVPVGIAGSDAIARVSDLLRMPFTRPHIHASIGPPLRFPRVDRLPTSAALSATTTTIMQGIAAQLPERYRGVYAGPAGHSPATSVSSPGSGR